MKMDSLRVSSLPTSVSADTLRIHHRSSRLSVHAVHLAFPHPLSSDGEMELAHLVEHLVVARLAAGDDSDGIESIGGLVDARVDAEAMRFRVVAAQPLSSLADEVLRSLRRFEATSASTAAELERLRFESRSETPLERLARRVEAHLVGDYPLPVCPAEESLEPFRAWALRGRFRHAAISSHLPEGAKRIRLPLRWKCRKWNGPTFQIWEAAGGPDGSVLIVWPLRIESMDDAAAFDALGGCIERELQPVTPNIRCNVLWLRGGPLLRIACANVERDQVSFVREVAWRRLVDLPDADDIDETRRELAQDLSTVSVDVLPSAALEMWAQSGAPTALWDYADAVAHGNPNRWRDAIRRAVSVEPRVVSVCGNESLRDALIRTCEPPRKVFVAQSPVARTARTRPANAGRTAVLPVPGVHAYSVVAGASIPHVARRETVGAHLDHWVISGTAGSRRSMLRRLKTVLQELANEESGGAFAYVGTCAPDCRVSLERKSPGAKMLPPEPYHVRDHVTGYVRVAVWFDTDGIDDLSEAATVVLGHLFAHREGWLRRPPAYAGDPLIVTGTAFVQCGLTARRWSVEAIVASGQEQDALGTIEGSLIRFAAGAVPPADWMRATRFAETARLLAREQPTAVMERLACHLAANARTDACSADTPVCAPQQTGVSAPQCLDEWWDRPWPSIEEAVACLADMVGRRQCTIAPAARSISSC